MILAQQASPEFNRWLGERLLALAEEVRALVGANLAGLLLGGGYGRGEGGVVLHQGQERPYNDLDFTLVLERKAVFDPRVLEPLRRKYAQDLGIHVDFSRPLDRADWRGLPPWLMWKELWEGHLCLAGDCQGLARDRPAWLDQPLPAIEASKLLLNRGAGLLWAILVAEGRQPEPDLDFTRRNYQKAALALGDALLIAFGRHQTAYRGRDANLRRLAGDEPRVAGLAVLEPYQTALAFKFRPDDLGQAPPDPPACWELAAKWGEVWLCLEGLRLGRAFADLAAYAAWPGLREPAEHRLERWPRNLWRNLQRGRLSWRYPREDLFRQLPRLLGPDRTAPDWQARAEAFLALWDRFN